MSEGGAPQGEVSERGVPQGGVSEGVASEGGAPQGDRAKAARQLAERKRARPTDDWRARNRDSALTFWARDPGVTRTVFRSAAIAEAFTWLGLLVGMYFKHVAETTEVGVQVFGPLHGAMFIVYCVVVLATRSVFGWSAKATLLGLAAAVPPFTTVLFERWALSAGLLDNPAPQPART